MGLVRLIPERSDLEDVPLEFLGRLGYGMLDTRDDFLVNLAPIKLALVGAQCADFPRRVAGALAPVELDAKPFPKLCSLLVRVGNRAKIFQSVLDDATFVPVLVVLVPEHRLAHVTLPPGTGRGLFIQAAQDQKVGKARLRRVHIHFKLMGGCMAGVAIGAIGAIRGTGAIAARVAPVTIATTPIADRILQPAPPSTVRIPPEKERRSRTIRTIARDEVCHTLDRAWLGVTEVIYAHRSWIVRHPQGLHVSLLYVDDLVSHLGHIHSPQFGVRHEPNKTSNLPRSRLGLAVPLDAGPLAVAPS
mmetsp:Transcript_14228/g.40610  ORF Transcript_14228/g.40610 Transcript_14228/m.40610 type:complete len:303 (-) Transcript_14228:111-1019(-)